MNDSSFVELWLCQSLVASVLCSLQVICFSLSAETSSVVFVFTLDHRDESHNNMLRTWGVLKINLLLFRNVGSGLKSTAAPSLMFNVEIFGKVP